MALQHLNPFASEQQCLRVMECSFPDRFPDTELNILWTFLLFIYCCVVQCDIIGSAKTKLFIRVAVCF